MDYTISELIAVKPNAYQTKSGIRFKVQGVEHQLSALTDTPNDFQVGAIVHGTIVSKEKDGKVFYNFNTAKKSYQSNYGATVGGSTVVNPPPGDINHVEMKVDLVRSQISTLGGQLTDIQGVLGEILRKVTPVDDINAEPF